MFVYHESFPSKRLRIISINHFFPPKISEQGTVCETARAVLRSSDHSRQNPGAFSVWISFIKILRKQKLKDLLYIAETLGFLRSTFAKDFTP